MEASLIHAFKQKKADARDLVRNVLGEKGTELLEDDLFAPFMLEYAHSLLE